MPAIAALPVISLRLLAVQNISGQTRGKPVERSYLISFIGNSVP